MSLLSGQITVTTAGTAVAGPDVDIVNAVLIRGLTGNTGLVYVGNDGAGDVTSANGFELDSGEDTIELSSAVVTNLSQLYFDAATSGDKLCWILA